MGEKKVWVISMILLWGGVLFFIAAVLACFVFKLSTLAAILFIIFSVLYLPGVIISHQQ